MSTSIWFSVGMWMIGLIMVLSKLYRRPSPTNILASTQISRKEIFLKFTTASILEMLCFIFPTENTPATITLTFFMFIKNFKKR
jgi:hypothetical protein